MRKPHRFMSARESHQFEQLWTLKMAATDLHNVDAFFKRGASLDLLELSVFPRSSVVKEISECESLREAALRYLLADPTDPNIVARVGAGDGRRYAARRDRDRGAQVLRGSGRAWSVTRSRILR